MVNMHSLALFLYMRKNSYQNRSQEGAKTQAILMSIYRILKMRGHNPIHTIIQALFSYIEKGVLPYLSEATSTHD